MSTSNPPHLALEARPGDGVAIANLLANAFLHDPLMSYIFPDAASRLQRLQGFYGILHRGAVRYGAVYATPGLQAATLWRGPGHAKLSLIETLREGRQWVRATRLSLPRALSVSAAVEAHHPAPPHWYLQIAGTDPAVQGRGYGSAAIRAGIARATAERLPCYLETAVPGNVPLYEHLGFAVREQWTLRNGMPFWGMWRECGAGVVSDA